MGNEVLINLKHHKDIICFSCFLCFVNMFV